MPTCRRKRVVLTQPSDELLQSVKTDPNREVFYLRHTGEIFETYEAYAARMSFYRLKQFQCEVTGKSGLDYFQALESERQEARTLHARFSAPLKPAILKAVQWQVVGRLDHLVEAVYERFKDRYFKGERVLVDLQGTKYYGTVDTVYPPKFYQDQDARDARKENRGSSPKAELDEPHLITGDLKIPAAEVNAQDRPERYFYWVQITEPEKEKAHDKAKNAKKQDEDTVGSLMEVTCQLMSRDRLSFSKSILRRFIRDCVDRDAAVASPWTVKPAIAKRYGVDSVMPEETRKDVESIKKGEIDKRKKVWEDKEGPPSKRQKKMTAAQEERAEKREREAREKAEKQRLAKEEAERIAAEKKKKKPVRYPTEDLDVRLADKDKKAGMKIQKPIPSRTSLPFNDSPGTFEAFLMSWNFLIVYGYVASNISVLLETYMSTVNHFISQLSLWTSMSMPIRHSVEDPPCPLLAEIHSILIYNLRTVPFHRHSAVMSLIDEEASTGSDMLLGQSISNLTAAMADIGNNWERVPLRHAEGRQGWEDALVGCLKDHANTTNFPLLREILTKLLFAPEEANEPSTSSSASSSRSPAPQSSLYTVPSSPAERYHSLPPVDRIAILSFLTNLAVSSKAIHAHMESCEEQLTALRKEKIEVNRSKKQLAEEMNSLLGETKDNSIPPDEDISMQEASDSEVAASDAASDSLSTSKKGSSRQKDLRQKMQTQAKQREAARAKQASVKQAMAEHRRLDEEVNKIERRLEGIEREFRKLLGGVRVKPLGRDRFYNRIWWFDGLGSASLVGSGGVAQYGTGRIFIQGPSETDMELLRLRQKKKEKMVSLDLESGPPTPELEELDEFVAWLNPKGHREVALKAALTKWWIHITSGIRKRTADVQVNAKLPEARRSTRTKAHAGYDISREPYMMWTNRRAVNTS
ncbi:chromatin remodeling complex protein [Desarmillaria tabescens]|uniref:Chromatin remodeling complex protein n=1 Tax=Armillaria tabescens TaxID=1929756 RepID=A0AA39TNT8_ARMTA|nr:chromatin remodeling complex protein [Desarmillaria tabescens]KAK0465402.1 chromatin remodeling complex protein [Desarmillaria tabescens]